ncbi:BAR and SH3 domain-containing protein [Aspergillus neoniger CBS 115656]|uniref:SH3 domain signaling protein n=1 Tax=Aspergillus neoniger (strain CBS 115656) TaxID=1448310 RepID=A0A318YTW9_ASPNB|nr:SH3 domain signaling protein [Aspergillus neoniger CBS 115656]PYH38255.1 SH3 domain signaling protein [Aspergillus neoniger CBS 115656]
MQSMQRQFGRLMKRSADDSQVAILLKDFEEADKILGRIIDSTSAWRDAWSSLLTHQNRMLSEFEGLYAPILGSSDSSAPQPALTPQATLARTNKLREHYEDLRKDLLGDLAAIDDRMIRPASQAREFISPVKKTIKKRDDRKLDFERYQGRVDSYAKKTKRSDRDNAALAKAESDLAKATEDYHAADDHLRKCLPPLIAAAFSLLPRLLATQIEIQNTMLANYYTVVHNYCQETQFPSPAPPMEQVIQEWERDHLPVQQEVEAFDCIVNGKTVKMSQVPEDSRTSRITSRLPAINGSSFSRRPSNSNTNGENPPPKPPRPTSPSATAAATATATAISNKKFPPPPKPSYDTKPSPVFETKPRLASSASNNNLTIPSTYHLSPQPSSSPGTESYYSATEHARTPSPGPSSSVAARADYFSRIQPSSTPSSAIRATSPGVSALVAGKKKPPPPPPPRANSNNAMYVTALYDFGGQSAGDLAFREGDRIRVLKKTESTDDWWEGELRGVKGSFPANYVE